VSDRSGGEVRIPGRPWHFAGVVAAQEIQMPARQGEHNSQVLHELGYSRSDIAKLVASGALVEPGRGVADSGQTGEASEVTPADGVETFLASVVDE